MKTYRQEVRAMRYSPDTCRAIHEWLNEQHPGPCPSDRCFGFGCNDGTAWAGDWVVQGKHGTRAMSDREFRDTFAEVEK